MDSVEEVQRGRSGSAVGITPPGGPGALSAGVGSGSGAGTVAAAVVATGSPARSGQQQYVGGGGVAGSTAVGVAGAGGVAAVRQRSASTVLDINLPQRKVSVGGGLAGPPSPVIRNGFSVYDPPQSLISSRHSNFNGQGVGGGGTAGAIAAGGTATGVGIATTNRGRLSISAASGGPLIGSSSQLTGGAGAAGAGLSATTGGASAVSGSTLGEPTGGSGSAPTIGGTAPIQPGPKRQGSFSNVFSKLIDGMPAGTMFAKFKSTNVAASTATQAVADGNPITQYFEIGKPVACAGPELVWRIHDAYRKSDNKVSVSSQWHFWTNWDVDWFTFKVKREFSKINKSSFRNALTSFL